MPGKRFLRPTLEQSATPWRAAGHQPAEQGSPEQSWPRPLPDPGSQPTKTWSSSWLLCLLASPPPPGSQGSTWPVAPGIEVPASHLAVLAQAPSLAERQTRKFLHTSVRVRSWTRFPGSWAGWLRAAHSLQVSGGQPGVGMQPGQERLSQALAVLGQLATFPALTSSPPRAHVSTSKPDRWAPWGPDPCPGEGRISAQGAREGLGLQPEGSQPQTGEKATAQDFRDNKPWLVHSPRKCSVGRVSVGCSTPVCSKWNEFRCFPKGEGPVSIGLGPRA